MTKQTLIRLVLLCVACVIADRIGYARGQEKAKAVRFGMGVQAGLSRCVTVKP